METPFGLWVWMSQKNHALDWDPHLPWEGEIFGKGAPIVKYRDFLP